MTLARPLLVLLAALATRDRVAKKTRSVMIRVSVISDSVDHIDGVAIGLRRLVAASPRARVTR